MSHNCPICNKAGLPDYTKKNVICPQCNSDLTAFLLLNSISKPQKSKIGTYVIIGISLMSVTFLGLLLKSNSDYKDMITKNVVLNDSFSTMNEEKKQQPIPEKQDAIIKYMIKKGDYPYRIAQFFYNDGNKYKQIEADNNLIQPYTLKVGQILIIKIPQE